MNDLDRIRQAVAERRRLDAEMADLIRQLERLSHGATYGYNGSGGGPSEPDAWVESVERRRDLLEPVRLRRKYDEQTHNRGRERVIAEAKETVAGWAIRDQSKAAGAGSVSEADVICEKRYRGWSAEDVAKARGVPVKVVRDARKAKGFGTEDGFPTATAVILDKAAEAVAQVARGVPTRKVAANLGVSQSMVMKWVRQAAA